MLKINIERVDYGETFAIADVELCVAKEEILCLLGHNGAGKTTMIHALCGLINYCNRQVILNTLFLKQGLTIFNSMTSSFKMNHFRTVEKAI